MSGFSANPGRLLLTHTDTRFPGYDTKISDIDREREWEREFREFERAGTFPALEIVRFPNDHTDGTRPGYPTPRAMVASNDLAVGQIVDRVSHSRYWPQTAIFIMEDDAQDGPDHVDARRTACLAISPYIRRGTVDSTLYTTSSMVRFFIAALTPSSPARPNASS